MPDADVDLIILTQTKIELFWFGYILETKSQENTSPIALKNIF